MNLADFVHVDDVAVLPMWFYAGFFVGLIVGLVCCVVALVSKGASDG